MASTAVAGANGGLQPGRAWPRSDRLAGGAGMQTLELIREIKLHALLPECSANRRLEASGVVAQDSHFIIIFDNLGQVARVAASCLPSDGNGWLGWASETQWSASKTSRIAHDTSASTD